MSNHKSRPANQEIVYRRVFKRLLPHKVAEENNRVTESRIVELTRWQSPDQSIFVLYVSRYNSLCHEELSSYRLLTNDYGSLKNQEDAIEEAIEVAHSEAKQLHELKESIDYDREDF